MKQSKTRSLLMIKVVEKLLVILKWGGRWGGEEEKKMTMIKEVLERKTLERQKGGGYDEESRQ